MRNFSNVGIQVPVFLIPKNSNDLSKWAVVACDQFTSQPKYWQAVEEKVGKDPSAYHLILPEAYLGTRKEQAHQERIPEKMRAYLESRIFSVFEGMIYIERDINGKTRNGLIAAMDLERYDYHPASQSLIRATEGTILERIPPRIKIRQQAPLEIPHVMVLIDDPAHTVIEPLAKIAHKLNLIYDFELMMGGGRIRGYLVDKQKIEAEIVSTLRGLLSPENQQGRYHLRSDDAPLLVAVGDGNHSLATAKSIWERMKSSAPADHPARYAMVEIVNIHDDAIIFEPIHRVIKGCPIDILQGAKEFFNQKLEVQEFKDFSDMRTAVLDDTREALTTGVFNKTMFAAIKPFEPRHTLAVGNLQIFLDDLLSRYTQMEIDYIHGDEAIQTLGRQPGHAGFFLPAMMKDQLFSSVIHDGPLPRKTFSMGEAHEKRYYLESRIIQDVRYEP